MNVNGFTHKPARTGTVRLFPLVLTGALLFGMQPLQAAAINEAWTNFLAGGPQTWATTPPPTFTPAIDSAIWQVLNTDTAAQALSNPMIEYLEWRRNLDPTRFDANHPNLAPALEQLLSSPSLPSNPPPPTSTPVPSTPVPSTPVPETPTLAQTVTPPTVPEPSSLLLAAAITGWGIWWRRQIANQTSW
jgi:PEP-CTERM motif